MRTYRRVDIAGKRLRKGLQAEVNAHQALGRLEPGVELFGFTKGQFSLINLIIAVLDQTGPADVTVATWTAAQREIRDAERLLRERRITRLRFLVDFSFPRRQPAYCALLRETFGDDTLRVTKTHAKFVTIRNDRWSLVIRTSMNLNENPRFEMWELSDDPEMLRFLEALVDAVFEDQPVGAGFERRCIENVEEWQGFGLEVRDREDASALGADLDDPMNPGLSFEHYGTPRPAPHPHEDPQAPRIPPRRPPRR